MDVAEYEPEYDFNDARFEHVMNAEMTSLFVENENKGAIYLELVDFNELYATASIEPVIINNFDVTTLEDKERLNSLLYTRYEGDTLDVVPTCDCGKTHGNDNINITCPNCLTQVTLVTERPLESTLWIGTPRGVKALIHPLIWSIMAKPLTKGGCNLLEWMVNSSYKPTSFPPTLDKLKGLGFPRSLNFFHDNFDMIMEELLNKRIFNFTTKQQRDDFVTFMKRERKKVFCQFLPIPSKLSFVTENNANATYADMTMAPAIEAIRTISSIESSISVTTPTLRERRVVKAISHLAKYYYTFTGKPLGNKQGWFRQHIFGGRPHFSARAVISSQFAAHKPDECVLPWGLAVMMMKIHIINKLMRRGFSPNQANRFVFEHVKQYSPLLDEIFQELIDESVDDDGRKGLRIILHRNPSLDRLSAQALYVVEIRRDPKINTIGMSTLILVAKLNYYKFYLADRVVSVYWRPYES